MRNASETSRFCYVCKEIKPRNVFPESAYRLKSGVMARRFIGPCGNCYDSGQYWGVKTERECRVCLAVKPAAEFYRHKYTTRTGKESTRFMTKCKRCHLDGKNTLPENLRRKDPRTAIEAKRAYNSKDRVRENRRRWYEAWLREDAAPIQKAKRTDHLKRKYGITHEQYLEMLSAQGGKCVTCNHAHAETPTGRTRLYIDHDHATGKIRGLLCHACNASLGLLREDPVRLRALADYLEINK